jgi:hypothetical protein
MAGSVMWPSLSSMSRAAERVVSEDRSATPEQHRISVSNSTSREGDTSPADSNASNGTAEETDEVIQVQTEVERRATTILVDGPDGTPGAASALRLMNGVNEMLECPVCQDVMLPPIFQVSILIQP